MNWKKHLTGKNLIIAAIILLSSIALWRIISGQNDNSANLNKTKHVNLIEIKEYQKNDYKIPFTGQIIAKEQVDLKSELNSTVKNIYHELGDTVAAGDLLIELDHGNVDAQLAQAAASVARVQNGLDQRIIGATDEQIKQAEISIEQTKAGIKQAEAQLAQTILGGETSIKNAEIAVAIAENNYNNTDTNTDLAIDNAYDAALSTASSNVLNAHNMIISITRYQYEYFNCQYSICYPIADNKAIAVFKLLGAKNAGRWDVPALIDLNGGVKGDLENILNQENYEKTEVDNLLINLEDALYAVRDTLSSLRQAMDSAYGNKVTVADKAAVDAMRSQIEGMIASTQQSQNATTNSQINSETSDSTSALSLEQAQANLAAAIKQAQINEDLANAALALQNINLAQAENNLLSLTKDPRAVDLAGLQAAVQEAQASYSLMANNQSKAFIRAPFSGEIYTLPVKKGQFINAGQILASLLNPSGLEIKTFINTADALKINVGTEVILENELKGVVANISPAIDPSTKKVEVIIAISEQENTENLIVGQYINGDIKIKDELVTDDIYYFPLKAIKITTEKAMLFSVNENGEVISHEIILGKVTGEKIEVQTDLDENLKIIPVVRGLEEGEKVEIIN